MSALGSLVVKLALEYAQYTQGLDKSSQAALAYGKRVQTAADQASRAMEGAKASVLRSVAGIGAGLAAGLSVAAFGSMIKGAIDTADELNKLAQKTGMTTEALSQWRHAAKLSNVTNESFNTGLKKLNVSIAEGLAGDKQKIALFKALGITTADLGKGTEFVMMKIADAYSTAGAGAGKQENAIKLLGKAGDDMIPLLNGGSKAIRDMKAEADKLGLTISGDFAKRAEEFNDNLTRMKAAGEGAAIAMGDDLVTALGSSMKAMAEAAVEGGKLAGVMAFIQTLFTGDDRYKNDKALVELTDKLLQAENALSAARAAGMNPAGIAAREKWLAQIKEEMKTTLAYRKVLDDADAKAKAAASKAESDRKDGPQIKSPGAAATESEYDKLIKRIRERIDLSKQELEAGRELTEEEKFAAKALADLGLMKQGATQKQHAYAEALLKESAATTATNTAREKAVKREQAEQAQREEWRKEVADAFVAESKAIEAARTSMAEYLLGIREENELTAFEISLMDRSAESRDRLVEHFRVELDLRRKIREIEARKLPGAVESEEIGRARQGAADRHKGVDATFDLKTLKEIDDFLDPAKAEAFGAALRDAFGSAGNALAQLSSALNDYGQQQAEIAKQQAALAATKDVSPEDRIKREIDLAKKLATVQIGSFANMAGAAKGFFKEGTKGYKALEGAEKAFRLFELASRGMAFAQKMGWIAAETTTAIASDQLQATSAVAGAGVEVGAKMSIASANAVAGVANQANGDPYTAFFRMAAMAAIMAGLGLAVAGGGGGGGGVPTSELRQKTQGTGTVLGDDDAKSESLLNALEGLADNSNIALKYSSAMLATLRSINDGIKGLATNVLRASGLRGTRLDEIAAGVGSSRSFLGFSKSSTTLMDQGLFIAPGQSVGGIRGGGIDAQKYTETETSKSSWFGLSKKTSRSTTFEELEAAISAQFTRTVSDIAAGVEQTAGAFGVAGDDLLAQINGFTVDIGMISLKGLNGEEIEAELAAVFGQLGDNMAKAVIPGLDDFQRIGEGYFETAVRVASGVELADFQLEQFGLTAIDFSQVLRKQGDISAEIVRQTITMANMAGDALNGIGEIINTLDGSAEEIADTYNALLDVRDGLLAVGITGDAVTRSLVRGARDLGSLQSGIDSFFQNFFSEEEQLAANTARLQGEFAALGLAMPIGKDGFRSLVLGIDETTEAGQFLLGKLLPLSEAFKDVADAAAQAAEAAAEALMAEVERTESGLMDAYNRESAALKQTIDQHKAYAKQLRAFRDSLFLGDLSTLSLSEKSAEAKRQFDDTYAKAQAGDLEAIAKLQGASTAYLEALKNGAATKAEFDVGFAKIAAALTLTASKSDAAASIAQQQLTVMTNQMNALGLLNDTVLGFKEAMLAYLQAKNAAIAGGALAPGDGSAGSMNAGQSAVAEVAAYGAVYGDDAYYLNEFNNYDAKLASYTRLGELTGMTADEVSQLASGHSLAYWQAVQEMWDAGLHPTTTDTTIPGFANGGFPHGLSMVGERGPELVDFQTPARVYTAEQSRNMLSGGGRDPAVETLVRQLLEENKTLRQDARIASVAMTNELQKVAALMKKIDEEGLAQREPYAVAL